MGQHDILMDWKDYALETEVHTKYNLHVQCNPDQNSNTILHIKNNNAKMYMETQKMKDKQRTPGQK